MKIFLYHLRNSRSQRILWLLEELGCEYQLCSDHQTQEIPSTHLPLKYPTIKIETGDDVLWLSESNAICDFLCELHGELTPTACSLDEAVSGIFWKHYVECSFMQSLLLKQVFNQIVLNTPYILRPISLALKTAFFKRYLDDTIYSHLVKINDHLESFKWVCGDEFSYVDIMIWFPLFAATVDNQEQYPFIKRYLKDLSNRPAHINALEIGQFNQSAFLQYWK